MVQYVITPWRDRGELLRVRQQLYPSGASINDEDRRHAVARVSVWVQRGNCPHLVESTAILTSARLNDVSANSNYCIRAAYSAAFSRSAVSISLLLVRFMTDSGFRFVTGLLDSHQDKRRKLSMYSVAKTIGLPATFVELRHQATHEELPSISKLRTSTQKALQWIWDYYWAKLAEDPEHADDCKAYLERLVRETDTGIRLEMEAKLSGWNQNKLLSTLLEIDEETEDPQVLLASCTLYQKLLGGTDSDESDTEGVLNTTTENLDDIIAELATMEDNLSTTSDDNVEVKNCSPPEDVTPGKGWAKWEGPWIPTPIGTIL